MKMLRGLLDKLKNLSRNRKKTLAQGIVEFALILPILLLLVLGIIEFGRLIFMYAIVTSSSREAVRYGAATGALPGKHTGTQTAQESWTRQPESARWLGWKTLMW